MSRFLQARRAPSLPRISSTAARRRQRGCFLARLGAWTASIRRHGRDWDLDRGDAVAATKKISTIQPLSHFPIFSSAWGFKPADSTMLSELKTSRAADTCIYICNDFPCPAIVWHIKPKPFKRPSNSAQTTLKRPSNNQPWTAARTPPRYSLQRLLERLCC